MLHRWEVIASFITQHLPESKRTAKEVLSHAKSLQKDDTIHRKHANESAFERTMKTVSSKGPPPSASKMDDPSQRYMCELFMEDFSDSVLSSCLHNLVSLPINRLGIWRASSGLSSIYAIY